MFILRDSVDGFQRFLECWEISKYTQQRSHPFQLPAATLTANGVSRPPGSPSLSQPKHLSFCITVCGLNHRHSAPSMAARTWRIKPIRLREWDPRSWITRLWMAAARLLLPHLTSKCDSSPFPGHASRLCSCPSFHRNVPSPSGLTAVCQYFLPQGCCHEAHGESIFQES